MTASRSQSAREDQSGRPGEHRRILITSVAIMMVVSLATAGIAIYVLYATAFEQHRARLSEAVQSRARLIEAMARHEQQFAEIVHPEGAEAATLEQVIDAHARFEGFGKTGEFVLARREGERIVWLLSHRHEGVEIPEPIAFNGQLAEPMRRALQGKSGTVVGLDYRGVRVLAAYEPVQVLDWGIAAKIDLAEIREPFFRAGGLAVGIAILLVLLGFASTLRLTSPLFGRLEDHARKLRVISDRLRAAVAEEAIAEDRERRKLAVDLHDGLGQLLAFASMKLGMLRESVKHYGLDSKVREVEELVSESQQRTGTLTFQLCPPLLHDVGLEKAAQWLADDLEQRLGLHVALEGGGQEYPLDEEIRTTLYRSLRELLINVVKHARTDRARVCIAEEDGFLRIDVEDEGGGFDTEATSFGYGLMSIKERLNHVGGTMEIESAPDEGTRVTLLAPVARSEAGGQGGLA